MTEAGIGRVLVASLHQGIADILPTRLEFYENWLNPEGLRHGTIGLAPLHAVLSFLRLEGRGVPPDQRGAPGEYSAEWTVASQRHVTRSFTRRLPARLRARARSCGWPVPDGPRRPTSAPGPSSGCAGREGTVDLRGSLFCGIRDSSARAALRLLRGRHSPASSSSTRCRGGAARRVPRDGRSVVHPRQSALARASRTRVGRRRPAGRRMMACLRR